jgi:hypothetical protein
MSTESLKTLCNKVGMVTTLGSKEAPEGWAAETLHWRVKLAYQRRTLTVDFYTGPLAGEPRRGEDVVDCLLSDSQAGEQDFEEFCRELGYDLDSRKAEKVWRACKAMAPKVQRLLGEDYEKFLYSDRN